MSASAIHMLGEFTVDLGGKPAPPFPTRSAGHLLAYLVLRRGVPQDRELLAGALWGERTEARSRKCLRSALWQLRASLQQAGIDPGTWFVVEARRMWFRRDAPVSVDVHLFEEAVADLVPSGSPRLQPEEAERLLQGVGLYRGLLLPGIYEAWALQQQERLHLLYILALERLVLHYEEAREWGRALWTSLALLREDPIREPVHRTVMRCHTALGDRPSALRQYLRLEEILERELEVEPMPESASLYRAIRRTGTSALFPGEETLEEGVPGQTGGRPI